MLLYTGLKLRQAIFWNRAILDDLEDDYDSSRGYRGVEDNNLECFKQAMKGVGAIVCSMTGVRGLLRHESF